jgi:hypothetical protein
MAKFINKKEQVFDIQLTPYGRHMLSMGQLQPVYYGFFDNNLIYDGKYVGITETQSEISQRIKRDTQYLEGLVSFEDLEELMDNTNPPIVSAGAGVNYFEVDVNPIQITPKKDSYRFTSLIGDAHLDGEQQAAPAWKVVTLNGEITSTTQQDSKNDIKIPQVNITLNYSKDIQPALPKAQQLKQQDFRNVIASTGEYADGNAIKLISDDLMLYVEELNTDMLNENFDIEIFEIETNAGTLVRDAPTDLNLKDAFRRKYFREDHQRIMGGLLTAESLAAVDPITDDVRDINFSYTTSSVGYYFDVIKDHQIDKETACRSVQVFNKESYYIDLDFDCAEYSEQTIYNVDLYGPVTEPEICP